MSSSALSFIRAAHIGARALHVLNLIWFGNIPRLSQWEEGGLFRRSNEFYLPWLHGEGGGGGGPGTLWFTTDPLPFSLAEAQSPSKFSSCFPFA